MAAVSALRDGLKTRLATISGLRAHDTVPDSITPPAAIVGVPEITFDTTMGRGADTFVFPILVFVSKAVDRVGQDALDAYCAGSGATSIKAAILGDRRLGGAALDAHVSAFRPLNAEEFAGYGYYGGEFSVTVLATGA